MEIIDNILMVLLVYSNMVQSFTLELPENIYFGKNSRESLPGVVRAFGRKVFILTGTRWFSESGWQNKIKTILKDFQIDFYQCPKGEPTIESINGVIKKARTFSTDVIIGIGGGTVLDTAKAVSGLMTTQANIEDYLEGIGKGLQLEKKGIPWIALPTTSGTGAEVTKNSVIKSCTHKVKKSLRSRFLIADAVIVDPEFTLDLPLYFSGLAGMDAFVQLLESFVSRKAKPVPRALAKEAIPVMLSALEKIPVNPSDSEARTGAAYGALISGLALANSGLGAVHGFASALGGLYEIPHGLICAVLLNPVLKANAEVIRPGLNDLFNQYIKPGDDPVQWIIEKVDTLLQAYGIRPDFKEYSIKKEMVPVIAEKAAGSSMSGNPRELTLKEKEKILLEVI